MNNSTRLGIGLVRLLLIVPPLLAAGCNNAERDRADAPRPEPRARPTAPQPATRPATRPATAPAEAEAGWKSLFDGRTLGNWRVSDFGGHGEPRVEDGKLIIPD